MEFNKDKATMSKKDAESKLEANDFMGAKMSALEAQSLYPGLDGISQLLEIINVHLAGQERINGKPNWYQVLGVSPTADDGELRKRYLKWSLKLHPDKNTSVGAEEAFKLIGAAYSFLIDKQAREEYNQQTVYSGGPAPWWAKQAPAHAGGSSAPTPAPAPAPAPAQNVPPAHPRQTGEQSMPTHLGGSSAPPSPAQAPPRQTGEQSMPTHLGGSSAPPSPAQAPPRQTGEPSMPSHFGGSSAPPSPAPAPPQQTGEPSMPSHHGGSLTPPSPAPAPPRQTGEPSMPTHPGGSSMASEYFSTKSRNGKAKVRRTPNPPSTFFTICRSCRYKLKYPRIYLRCCLRCKICSNPFKAVEMDQSKFSRSAPRQRKT